jgi:RimJ/RimL family protein N-acetyltransferase
MLGGTVRGKRTTLRLPTEADLAAHARWSADLRIRRAGPLGRWHEPAMPATWKERFVEQAKDKTSILWSIDAGDALVGYLRVRYDNAPASDAVELEQLVIDPAEQRKGYGWDAALTLHRWIFDLQHLRMAMAMHVAADDTGRRRILEKLGHRSFAQGHDRSYRDGAYVDAHHYQMFLETWDERWGATEREYGPLAPGAEA